jgi:hypothetical protein
MVRFKEDGQFLSSRRWVWTFLCQFLVLAEEVPVGLRLTWVMMASGERIVQEIPVYRVRLSRREVDAELTRLSPNAVVQITLPRRDVIKKAAHDWLWIVRKDELDVARAGEAE